MAEPSRPPLDKAFVGDAIKDLMAKLRALELALAGLRKAQAISETDREALEFMVLAAHSDVADLYLALGGEQEERHDD
ncbi:MAG: hypothetical protein ACR652_10140 [Methylocystis sp.]|uniref:hypothetical protein n=1 Tax=Methylocystis sp. TaxID=1911079 RepID=UPI003DA47699